MGEEDSVGLDPGGDVPEIVGAVRPGLGAGDGDFEGVVAGGEGAELEPQWVDLVARTPVGPAEVRGGDALFQGVAVYHVGGGPESAGRVESAERSAVIAPRSPGPQGVAVEEDVVRLLHEFVAASVSAVACGDEGQLSAAGGGVEVEVHRERAVGEGGVGTLVVGELGGVQQGRDGAVNAGVAGEGAFLGYEAGAEDVALVAPGVDVSADPQGVHGFEPTLHAREVG